MKISKARSFTGEIRNYLLGATVSLSIIGSLYFYLVKYCDLLNESLHSILLIGILVVSVSLIAFQFNRLRFHLNTRFNDLLVDFSDAVVNLKFMNPEKYTYSEFQRLVGSTNRLLIKASKSKNESVQSEHLLHLLLQNVPIMVAGIDKNGIIWLWNKECEQTFNLPKQQIIGRILNQRIIFTGDSDNSILRYDKNPDGKFKMHEVRTIDHVLHYQQWASYQLDEKLTVWFGYDVTQQVEAEQKVKEQEHLLRNIMNSIPSPVYFKDLNGNLSECNKALADLFGQKTKSVVGKQIADLLPSRLAAQSIAMDQELIRKGGIQQFAWKMKVADNSYSHYKCFQTTFTNSFGKIEGIIGVMTDVTSVIEKGKAFKDKEQHLKRINTEKDKFMSIIAHDLKNPFTSLIGLLEIIKIQYDELDDDLLKKYIDVLNETANNQFKLLIDLLEWARSQNGNMPFNPQDIKLAELISQEIALYKDNLEEKNITIKNHILPNLYVYADYDMLCTVFRNLIGNAAKFSNVGGAIEILSQKNTTKVGISVKDYGIGMNKQQLQNLFRLEKRYSTPGTQMERGTGLGLLLCKEFIEKHGESIIVKSEPGKGTSFSFNLQLSKPSSHS